MVALTAAQGDIDPTVRKSNLFESAGYCPHRFFPAVIHIEAEETAGKLAGKNGDGISVLKVTAQNSVHERRIESFLAFGDDRPPSTQAQYIPLSIGHI